MAHPLKHAESSARKFGGKSEDYLSIHNLVRRIKIPFSQISATARSGITLKGFS